MNKQFGRHGILFVISAPSGAGKTTLVEALRQSPDLVYSISCTTRAPRAGEIEGEDYQFLSAADFHARAKARDFLEYAQVHGDYYGTLRKPLLSNLKNGVDVLIDIDTQGAAAIRNCDDPFIREALTDVFIMPPDLDELKSVLAMLRGDPGRIANLSMEKRVALAPACLAFLNLTLDDLRAAEGAA